MDAPRLPTATDSLGGLGRGGWKDTCPWAAAREKACRLAVPIRVPAAPGWRSGQSRLLVEEVEAGQAGGGLNGGPEVWVGGAPPTGGPGSEGSRGGRLRPVVG